MTDQDNLKLGAARGVAYRARRDQSSIYPALSADQLRARFDVGLPDSGRPDEEVINQLADAAEAGLVGLTGDAFYGWVMGSSNSVGVAADWMAAAWGQNAAIYQTAPSAAIAEEVAGKWLIDLLGLPEQSSIAFTTGATMASYICLAAARTHVLAEIGWDIEAQGQFGAPEISVCVSEEAHTAIFAALRYLGFGQQRLVMIKADAQGRMMVDDLAAKLEGVSGPAIVIAQAGHINTGGFDDFAAMSTLAKQHNAWLHIDGAFGLWAKASTELSHLCAGVELADSWAVDGHKWLQIPYESGFGIVRNAAAHRRAMTLSAGYLNESESDGRNPTDFVPEISRRARGFAVWAVLQNLGREGVSKLVEGNCKNAVRLAAHLSQVGGIRVLNDVSLNQISVVFEIDDGTRTKACTAQMVSALQSDGRWFVKEAVWRGETIMRLSFSSATKPDAQIDEFGDAIIALWEDIKSKQRVSASSNAALMG